MHCQYKNASQLPCITFKSCEAKFVAPRFGVHVRADTGKLSLQAWREPGRERRANAVGRAVSDPGRDQISDCVRACVCVYMYACLQVVNSPNRRPLAVYSPTKRSPSRQSPSPKKTSPFKAPVGRPPHKRKYTRKKRLFTKTKSRVI